ELEHEAILLLLLQAGAQVARLGAVHSRDLHVAAERDRPDAVLDAASYPLHERRREAEVELARSHADGTGGEEVTGLVDQDQERKAENRNKEAHRAGTSSRARRSASTSSSRSRAGAPSTRARTSSTAPAMSRNPIRPSRNACTATSLAAL